MILFLLLTSTLLFGCLPEPAEPDPDRVGNADWTAYFLNVGKADCCILEFDGLYYMIDAGEKSDHETVMAAIEKLGIKRLEALFITHCDKDHVGGMKKLLKNVEVGTVYGAKYSLVEDGENKLDNDLSELGRRPVRLGVGETVSLGTSGAYFTVLGPERLFEEENDNSLVLRLDGCGNSALFTGDCLATAERFLIDDDIDCDLLKVAHHGRDDASSYEFLRRVSPSVAVISTSRSENPKTAAETVVYRLNSVGADVYITEEYEFAIIVKSNNGEMSFL